MTALLVAPFALQGALMTVDELHFHRRRGLPRWERLGHPLDTLTVVATFLWLLAGGGLAGFAALAFFSCLFVTKDEPVHARSCGPGEQWLHALLFVLHPIVFLGFALLWREGGHASLLWLELGATALFGIYQLVYWSLPWRAAATR